MSELEAGMESVKRVTERVNEQKRIEENREIKEELAEQVIDFKVYCPFMLLIAISTHINRV